MIYSKKDTKNPRFIIIAENNELSHLQLKNETYFNKIKQTQKI